MNLADSLNLFLERIDTYITVKNITPTKFNPEFAIAESLTLDNLDKLTQDDCFNYAYQLYQYADHLGHERANSENVLRWCESNLQSMIASEINGGEWDQYAKYETKVATILRNNDLARKINDWKINAESRLEHLKGREYNVRRKADILIERGKRK